MKLAFAGTPEFAAGILARLIAGGHSIAAVYTQPDRPAGRGRRLQPSAVKTLALQHGLVLHQPTTLRGAAAADTLRALDVDALVVAAYGLILPSSVLDIPRHGCINVHASLLPRWRGAAPIQRAILAGDTVTGVSIMRMDEGLDTGPVLATRDAPIGARETAGELHDRLAVLGADCLLEVLDGLASRALPARPQDDAGATYAARLDKSEARLDWTRDAATLDRLVRAFNPVPIAWTTVPPPSGSTDAAARLRVLTARPGRGNDFHDLPGTVLEASGNDLVVACGRGELHLERVQPAGRKPVSAAEFINARGLQQGVRLT